MITVDYSRDGFTVSDFDAERYARSICSPDSLVGDRHLSFSTENIIHALKMLIAEGVVDCSQITFTFGGNRLAVNKYGACPNWPDGWVDTTGKMADRTLRAAAKRWRQERRKDE